MANCGIICNEWNIKGATGAKSTLAQLSDSLSYALNEEKTKCVNSIDAINQLTRECKYVENDLKTFSGAYIGGNNVSACDVKTAVSEMMEIKRFYGKEDKRAAKHLVISLPEEESDIKNAAALLQLCKDVVKEVFPKNQAIFAIHTNTENMHAHIIINTVGLDGKKLHENKGFISKVLHPCINKYALVHGFTQNSEWKKHYTESDSKLSFPQIKIMLRNIIDNAIEKSNSFDDFIMALEKENIKINVGKYISLMTKDMKKPVRTYNLGNQYTRDAIIDRILTRKDRFQSIQANTFMINKDIKNIVNPVIYKLPKYSEMTKEQKEKAIHQLKMGKNPWRENQKMNWQLNKIADDLNMSERARNYISFYSKDGSVNGAFEGMLKAKAMILEQRKELRIKKQKYKPVIDIYEEMKLIENKAYLYEHEDIIAYRLEHEQYRKLTNKLRTVYNKEIGEVANYLEECSEQELYMQAQLKEISLEYKELKKYAYKNDLISSQKEKGILDVIGYYEGCQNARRSVFVADTFYISSPHSKTIFQVIKRPAMSKNGIFYEKYEISELDDKGKVIKTYENDVNGKEFVNNIKAIETTFGFIDCKSFNTLQNAREFSKEVIKGKYYDESNDNNESMKINSFTQAINHVTVKDPVRVIVSAYNPQFIALASMEENNIKIVIFDKTKKANEVIRIPKIENKTSVGYKSIKELSLKYGFEDGVLEYRSLEEANKYLEESINNRKAGNLNAKL